jgi:enterochelin esterase-like enzyme/sugar lactone lactonase YvrE
MPAIRFLVVASLCAAVAVRAADDYVPGPDSLPHDGVPQGEVTKHTFEQSRIFPGTTRDYWVYVPKQYDPAKPACLYVGQDGVQFKAPVVFDNLIARHEMPVTIGVFIMHGRVKSNSPEALDRFNRSYEYDGLGPNYAQFLMHEILPEVEEQKTADGRAIHFSKDPNDRAIGGSSSGAICAFTVAWERPDAFRRVFSSIGTYVDQRGGNDYPALIRKTEAKPIRVFLQDGSNDLDRVGGNWHLANEEMLSALEFSGYEVNHIWGDGGHNGKQATAIFPDAMRWLWKDWPKPVEAGVDSRQPVAEILQRDEPWKQIFQNGHELRNLAVNPQGQVFFYDAYEHCIRQTDVEGHVSLFAANTGKVTGMACGRDGRLLASVDGKKIISFGPDGKSTVLARGLNARELCVGYNGNIYASDPSSQQIWLIDEHGNKTVAENENGFAGGLCLTPDQSLLLADDPASQFVHSFHIDSDGKLLFGQPYHHLRLADAATETGALGMAVDRRGLLYIPTRIGIQVCDQPGRGQAIIAPPPAGPLSNIVFAGADFDRMVVSGNGGIFARKVNAKGAPACLPPSKPAQPSL